MSIVLIFSIMYVYVRVEMVLEKSTEMHEIVTIK
jgi:hypothetical protein